MKNYEPEYMENSSNFIAHTGRQIFLLVRNAGRALLILVEAFYWFGDVFKRRSEVRRQMTLCSIKSFGVTATVALFTGMILALQAGLVLQEYGQQVNIGILVSQTMCREMGPFMTALILASSVGSAIAAEIATMKVSEEIDALHVMSINPVRFLVMPRLLALIVMLPVLTIFTNVIGILGGMLVGYTQLNVSPQAYYDNAMSTLENKEVFVGLFKSFVFAIELTAISCYQGLTASNGAVGVGLATRRTVVISFLLILVTGYFITRLFY